MMIEFNLLGNNSTNEKKINTKQRKPKTLEQVLLKIEKRVPNRLITLRYAKKIHYISEKETHIYDTVIFHNKIINHTINYVRQHNMTSAIVYDVDDSWDKHAVITIISDETEILKDF